MPPSMRKGTPVTPAEFRAARKALGLTQRGLSEALRLSEKNGSRSIRIWEKDGNSVPGPVQVAVELMLERSENSKTLGKTGSGAAENGGVS